MKRALITFVKAPVPGTVKTRLQPDLPPEKIVRVYKSFVNEILSVCNGLKGVDKFLGCTPTVDDGYLRRLSVKYNMQRFNQRGKTLGERIFNAFRDCSEKGYTDIVLIGSDSPSIPVDFIKKAFVELRKNDLVVGPCFDQGLYLIGVKREKINELSRKIKLDTGKDIIGILKKSNNLNIRFTMLPFWYDIDNIDDLEFLKLHLTYLKRLPL